MLTLKLMDMKDCFALLGFCSPY